MVVLTMHRGKVLTRDELFAEVRHLRTEPPMDFDASVDRSIDVHLSKIRHALSVARPGSEGIIRTVRGVGYILDLDADEPRSQLDEGAAERSGLEGSS